MGGFGSSRVDVGAAGARSPLAIDVGDVNADGRGDIATANVDSDTVTIFMQNNGSGFVDVETLSHEELVGPESVALRDIDGNGRIDVVTAGRISNNVVVFLQSAAGSFDAGALLELAEGATLEGALGLVVEDLDRDGRVDIVVGGHQSANLVVFFQSELLGSFEAGESVDLPDGAAPVDLGVVDLDADEDGDIVVASLGPAPLVLVRQSDARVLATSTVSAGLKDLSVTGLVAADLNADGNPDIALTDANETDPAIYVILASSTGDFDTTAPRVLRSDDVFGPIGLLAVDLDGDGELDLVSANRSTSTVRGIPRRKVKGRRRIMKSTFSVHFVGFLETDS